MLLPRWILFGLFSTVMDTYRKCLANAFVVALASLTLVASPANASRRPPIVILIGEMHGTNEIPRIFGNLAKVTAAAANKPIGVGFELSIALQPVIDNVARQHASHDECRSHLTAAPEWQKFEEYKDGRTSEAMLDVICELASQADSSRVSVFFFDTEIAERNETMAQAIATRIRKMNYGVTLVLTGNIHANRAPAMPGRPSIRPMGWFLAKRGFEVRSFDTRYNDGDTWACIGPCGVHHLAGNAMRQGKAVPPAEGYDGTVFVGAITASPPAKN